jgi:hypothetical protein
MINNYNDFLLEKLILESKLEFSTGFLNILKTIGNNKIALELLKIKGEDKDFIQNYIDKSSVNDELIFTPDRKAREILGNNHITKYKVLDNIGSKHLHFRKKPNGEYINKSIFDILGFIPKEDNATIPHPGDMGISKGEVVSKTSGKTFVWFVGDDGVELIVNKDAIMAVDETLDKVWNATSRTNMKVGRIVRALLTKAGISVTDNELVEFVNLYKSTFDVINDAFSKFELVNGSEISYWYSAEHYESETSSLGNSCMANVDSDFFDIYVENKDVCSLLILYSNDGEIENGKFKSSKIRGRALVWKTTCGDTFMDRIYTINDSDIDLFKQYCVDKNWWHKKSQGTSSFLNLKRGSSEKEASYVVNLRNSNFDHYPYLDSLMFLNRDSGELSNSAELISAEIVLNSTSGEYEDYGDY